MTRHAPVLPGSLYVVGTPIGNLEDITFRAVRVLAHVDLVAAEDTRRAKVLLSHYQITTRVMSYFQGNEAQRSHVLLQRLQQGSSIALISEAGMPGISDPGMRLIQACIDQGVPVDVIPGPNAALTALILSGLPSSQFTFLGFLPRSGKERQRQLDQLHPHQGTLIFYEAPPRVSRTLATLGEVLGDRPAALAREMTKIHQEVVRGTLFGLAEQYRETPPRGEVTLVVAGSSEGGKDLPREKIGETELEHEVTARLAQGESPRQIARALAEHGRRRIYQLALALSQRLTSVP